MANVRIKDQTTDTDLQTGDYVIVDSDSEGTRKYDLGALVARVAALEAGGRGVSDDLAAALLQLADKVAYSDGDGDECYQDLYDALDSGEKAVTYSLTHVTSSNTAATVESGSSYSTTLTADTGYSMNNVVITMGGVDVTSSVYSSGTVSITNVTGNIVITAAAVETPTSITATYTQSGTVYENTSLDSLKTDLVVVANMSGGGTETIPAEDYTLSGTLTVGTSTVTVTYAGLTDTFSVTVTAAPVNYLYNWDFTQSLIDSVSGQEAVLGAGNGHSNATRDENGLSFNEATQYLYLGQISPVGKTFEIDVASLDFKGSTSSHIRFFTNAQYTTSNSVGLGCICWKSGEGWRSYGWTSSSGTNRAWSANYWSQDLAGTTSEVINAFSGKTVKVVYHSDGHTKDLYLDNVYKGTIDDIYFNNSGSTHLSDKIFIAGMGSVAQASGDQCYDMTITGVRIYTNNE